MAIASLPMGIPPNLFYYRETISSTEEDWDLETKLLAAGWDGEQRVDALILINNGVLIGSSSLLASMGFEDVVPEDSLIILESHGSIYGVGGQGGNGGDASKDSSTIQISSSQGGGSGGRALWVRTPIILRNFGRIYGGGGGGGGGGAGGIKTDNGNVYGFAGGGGGGGAGYQNGSNRGNRGNNSTNYSDIPGGYTRASHGQNGTTANPGNGGARGKSDFDSGELHGGNGGNGGGIGSSGDNGTEGEGKNSAFDVDAWAEGGGGSGGSAGQAINGKSYITFEVVGDIKGAQVN